MVAKPSGADFEYKRVMKSYENVQELQRLVNEFVDYKGDSSDLVKPEKTLKKVVLKMSEPQREIQEKLEEIVSAGKESGDVIMGQGQMRLNLISPYITNYYK
ncbi:MAG: hypothetical protein LBG59_07515 [Candidatus Peribacteria bacterium]|nr:hypothetical protein [Candidatus Peribacteria bacterium]